MSRCAFFVSAPTVRFLRALDQLGLLPATQRRKIAAAVYAAIKPLVGSRDLDELRCAALDAQAERWRLISGGINELSDVAITEQWLLGQVDLVRAASPVAEVLAEKRCAAIENFIRDNIMIQSGEVIQLHGHASLRRTDRRSSSKTAA